MPEPGPEQHTPIEPHGYRKQMLPSRLVVTVLAGEILGEECAGFITGPGDFSIVQRRVTGAQSLVPIEFRAAAAMFRQGEIDDA